MTTGEGIPINIKQPSSVFTVQEITCSQAKVVPSSFPKKIVNPSKKKVKMFRRSKRNPFLIEVTIL